MYAVFVQRYNEGIDPCISMLFVGREITVVVHIVILSGTIAATIWHIGDVNIKIIN